MPSRDDIQKQITSGDRQDVVRRDFIKDLSKYTGRNTILYATAFTSKKVQLQKSSWYVTFFNLRRHSRVYVCRS